MDNRAPCWNLQTGRHWMFQVQRHPRNPDLLATTHFDGTVGIHSLQSTNESVEGSQGAAPTPRPDGSDVFVVPGFSRTTQSTLSLKQPPKWLRRPVSGSFGYGGNFVSVSNLPSAQGKNQSSSDRLRHLTTNPTIAERAKKLRVASDGRSLSTFAQEKSSDEDGS